MLQTNHAQKIPIRTWEAKRAVKIPILHLPSSRTGLAVQLGLPDQSRPGTRFIFLNRLRPMQPNRRPKPFYVRYRSPAP